MYPANHYVIREATAADGRAMRELAELDSQRPLPGPALIGEIAGIPAAALSLSDGRVVADPFQPTATLRQLLQMRASGVHAYARTPSLSERLRIAVAPFRARAVYGQASTGR